MPMETLSQKIKGVCVCVFLHFPHTDYQDCVPLVLTIVPMKVKAWLCYDRQALPRALVRFETSPPQPFSVPAHLLFYLPGEDITDAEESMAALCLESKPIPCREKLCYTATTRVWCFTSRPQYNQGLLMSLVPNYDRILIAAVRCCPA